MKWLKRFFCLLVALCLFSQAIYSEVCLTDQEYEELGGILTTLEQQLTIAEDQLKVQARQLRMANSKLQTAQTDLMTSQIALDKAETSLTGAEQSLKEQKRGAIITTVYLSVLSLCVGFGLGFVFVAN